MLLYSVNKNGIKQPKKKFRHSRMNQSWFSDNIHCKAKHWLKAIFAVRLERILHHCFYTMENDTILSGICSFRFIHFNEIIFFERMSFEQKGEKYILF